MPEKDPSTYGLITYLWVTGLAAWGGLVNFYRKVKSGETRAFNVVELIGEIATSAFRGPHHLLAVRGRAVQSAGHRSAGRHLRPHGQPGHLSTGALGADASG